MACRTDTGRGDLQFVTMTPSVTVASVEDGLLTSRNDGPRVAV